MWTPDVRILAYSWRDLAHARAGGAEVYLQSVASEWVQSGHAVTIFCASVPGRPEHEERDGVHIIRRGSRLGVYREARRYWEQTARGMTDLVFDVVNTRPFFAPSFVDVPVLALFYQVAREVWFSETSWPVALLGRYMLEPRWLRRYREVPTATISDSSKASLEAYGLRRVSIVPVGAPSIVNLRVVKETAPTLVFLGRLSANKRPGHALAAFEHLRKRIPGGQLWMIGDGPLRKALERSAPPGVTFFGRVDEARKFELLARAHLLVSTSVREGWGLGVTEAAQVGTPAVGYDVAGLRDSLAAHGGASVPPQPQALAERVAQALTGEAPLLAERGEGRVLPWDEVGERVLAAAMAQVVSGALAPDGVKLQVPWGQSPPVRAVATSWRHSVVLTAPERGDAIS
ncbi:MAG: glycosyltransferase family 4 protein [Acidimicrobiales bacterium]